jgi:hypothetical protein
METPPAKPPNPETQVVRNDSIPPFIRIRNLEDSSATSTEIRKDTEGEYIATPNGKRTNSFKKIDLKSAEGHIGLAFVTMDQRDDDTAFPNGGFWLIFDDELNKCTIIDYKGSFVFTKESVTYIKTSEGIWSWREGTGLTFRSFMEIFATNNSRFQSTVMIEGNPVDTYRILEVVAENGKFYLVVTDEARVDAELRAKLLLD